MNQFSSPFKVCKLAFTALSFLFFLPASSQKTLPAGKQYLRSGYHQWLWGKHYRKEWATPVTVPLLYLDAEKLVPYQAGGGRQSKTLRLRDQNNKEYVLRSIDKSFGSALPAVFQNTFVEKIVNDQVSLGHPYAAITIPELSEAAGVYHTEPRIVFLPQQSALDSFNASYGDHMYLFEQRPDENWEEADNFGNSPNIVGTDKMFEKVTEDNDNRIDQLLYVRARLFDMLIGDGSRHEDQWRWGAIKNGEQTIYKPIPRDRDQAYAKFDGWLLRTIMYMANINHLQTFKSEIRNVRTNNFPARNLDRRAANQVSKEQWVAIAKEIQSALDDNIIDSSIHRLPPEIYNISGPGIAAKLKSRRDHLHEYAADYYSFIARDVDIPGSEKRELFRVNRLPDGNTTISVSKISKKGNIETPYYTRTFEKKETKSLRLYGIAGEDVFELEGESSEGITVIIVGGADKDSINDKSHVQGAEKKTIIFDNHSNIINTSGETRLELSEDSSVHEYKYAGFNYNYERVLPVLFYSFEDKVHVGAALKLKRFGWRTEPYKNIQVFQVNYSIMQKALSFMYRSDFRNILGKWGLANEASYDLLRWTNYFGLGNLSTEAVDTRNYYRLSSKNVFAVMSLYHNIGRHMQIFGGPVYNMAHIIEEPGGFVYQSIPNHKQLYETRHFVGGYLGFDLSHVNNNVVPSGGYYFTTSSQLLANVKESKTFVRYDAQLQLFSSLFKNMILAIRPAVAHVTGSPEFYQHVSIGGSNTLRGYQRDRFWGTTSFYSDNELQYLFINGRYGLTAFYDVGRVWMKGEKSNTWHTGYGGGIIVAPFYKILASLTYGKSVEGNFIHVRLYRPLSLRF